MTMGWFLYRRLLAGIKDDEVLRDGHQQKQTNIQRRRLVSPQMRKHNRETHVISSVRDMQRAQVDPGISTVSRVRGHAGSAETKMSLIFVFVVDVSQCLTPGATLPTTISDLSRTRLWNFRAKTDCSRRVE